MKKFENRWIKKEDLKDIIELGKNIQGPILIVLSTRSYTLT